MTTPPRELGSSAHNLSAENCRLQEATEINVEPGEFCPACAVMVHEESVERARAYGTLREIGS